MNSILNKNLANLKERFPQLLSTFPSGIASIANFAEQAGITISESRAGVPTAACNGLALHSKYNPVQEAERLIATDEIKAKNTCCFLGFGLGYAPLAFAAAYPEKTLVLIEPNPLFFMTVLETLDFTPVIMHKNCVLLIGASTHTVWSVIDKLGLDDCAFCQVKSQQTHDENYYSSLNELLERNRKKDEINERTLERFGTLWLKNMCRNLSNVKELEGINSLKDVYSGLPACVIAAGPSLDTVISVLGDINRRCVTVCVDTALKSCLKAGFQPDFVVAVDPQYWNVRHLDGLKAPDTVLVAELATYPSVFHFPCKEIMLCSSMYPLGKYIEKFTGEKGELGAGGSVATTAWDFARFLGCTDIYTAGLDLSFPDNKTHFKGSTFEERSHRLSGRLHTAETDSFNALYGAYPFYKTDYNGKPVLTDSRMSLYAWWFESQCAAHPEIYTHTLTPQGLHIPGIVPYSAEKLLSFSDISAEKKKIFETKRTSCDKMLQKQRYEQAVDSVVKNLSSMLYSAQKAVEICKKGLSNTSNTASLVKQLDEIDKKIISNEAAELASLVFPGKKKLEQLLSGETNPLKTSLIVYQEVEKSIKKHLTALKDI
ncbi:MAG: motility associated factor glycosyltransferase family protein [Spirochaetaceae bacterium]|nr:motility associated factor glycosyltransferase family protein [Spirochaetaceae bacterium]